MLIFFNSGAIHFFFGLTVVFGIPAIDTLLIISNLIAITGVYRKPESKASA
jgi:predicted molibdopterin-dependent oxidoreductase YjgC